MRNKKDIIYNTLISEKIDICALQEVEIPHGYEHKLLSSKDYQIEVEKASGKARTAIVIKKTIDYTRRIDLEREDSSLIILDINCKPKVRLINIYRSFNPPNEKHPLAAFREQLEIIKSSLLGKDNLETIILGDFNLDYEQKNLITYRFKNYFEPLNDVLDTLNLSQIVTAPTWQRIVNGTLKESLLDHVYTRNPINVINLILKKTLIGDHSLVIFNFQTYVDPPEIVMRRCWKNYNKEILCDELSKLNFDTPASDPQSIWNHFEQKLLTVVDTLVPYVPFTNNASVKSLKPNSTIKSKLNLRKRLIKSARSNPSNLIRIRINNLNKEIKSHFYNQKMNNVQRSIIPGNSKSLWQAVKISKDMNTNEIPKVMYKDGILIKQENIPDAFANFFKDKVQNIVNTTEIDPDVYNGKRKLNTPNKNFMTKEEVFLAIKSLKTKNCEGYDRLPQRILTDGINVLITPLADLFEKIYKYKKLPEQWQISKTIPIFKKGNPNNIENYRPISNLCSTSKIFEKLILLRLQKLEIKHKIDLTGKPQHGFKQKRSTATASLTLQSLLARALDGDNYALMASLDLSSAFDVVNVDLLIKRLSIIGIPDDIITLISEWLKSRFFYVKVGDNSSIIHSSNVGTVQGSILGPILYAIFVSPLFDLAEMTLFADDNYLICWNRSVELLIVDMKKILESVIKWLRQSGLKVNDSKTELCLFHRKDHLPITLTIYNDIITSKDHMNVLGITFDSKLQWHHQVKNTINKSKMALNAIYLIRKYFNKRQLLSIITSNYYSILYYNANVWLLPTLSPQLKQKLLSASAAPLKLTTNNYNYMMSFESLHYVNQRATPTQYSTYTNALLLHKVFNDETMSNDWLDLFFNQNFNQRYATVKFFSTANFKIGGNILSNRFISLNGQIELSWLNESYNNFKIKCKSKFLCH